MTSFKGERAEKRKKKMRREEKRKDETLRRWVLNTKRWERDER